MEKTDPRASHLAISQGVGSIHAPFSRSLYTIQGWAPDHLYIHIYIYTHTHCTIWRQGRGREMCARDTFPSRSNDRISRFDDGESKLPRIEMEDERIERIRLDGIEGIRAREQSRKIVADLDIWISTTSWGEVGVGFDPSSIKILPIFRATADPGDQRSFSQLLSAGKP